MRQPLQLLDQVAGHGGSVRKGRSEPGQQVGHRRPLIWRRSVFEQRLPPCCTGRQCKLTGCCMPRPCLHDGHMQHAAELNTDGMKAEPAGAACFPGGGGGAVGMKAGRREHNHTPCQLDALNVPPVPLRGTSLPSSTAEAVPTASHPLHCCCGRLLFLALSGGMAGARPAVKLLRQQSTVHHAGSHNVRTRMQFLYKPAVLISCPPAPQRLPPLLPLPWPPAAPRPAPGTRAGARPPANPRASRRCRSTTPHGRRCNRGDGG